MVASPTPGAPRPLRPDRLPAEPHSVQTNNRTKPPQLPSSNHAADQPFQATPSGEDETPPPVETARPAKPERPSKAARQAAIANYLIMGYSLTRIATTLGYSTRHISRDIKEMESRFRQQADQDLRFARGIDLERLDALLSFVWPQCEQGNVPAVRVAKELIERRAKLLGADAPRQIAQSLPDHRTPETPSPLPALTDAEALAIYRQVMNAAPQA